VDAQCDARVHYEDLSELYGEAVSSWNRYVGHVVTLVGGVHMTIRAADQEGPVYEPVAAGRQREAVAFLAREVFDTPTWLNDTRGRPAAAGGGRRPSRGAAPTRLDRS
jgi:hypothetical protein